MGLSTVTIKLTNVVASTGIRKRGGGGGDGGGGSGDGVGARRYFGGADGSMTDCENWGNKSIKGR